MMNVWRQFAADLWKWCRAAHGDAVASKFSKVPPSCVSERWGSVSACEKHVLGISWDVIQDVFFRTLAQKSTKRRNKAKAKAKAKAGLKGRGRGKAKPKPKPAPVAPELGSSSSDEQAEDAEARPLAEDPQLEAVEAFQKTFTRWSRETMQGINNKVFRFLVLAGQLSRAPLDHMHNFLMKKVPPLEVTRFAQLIFGKADSILLDLRKLIDDIVPITASLCDHMPLDMYVACVHFVKGFAWSNYVNFMRRVVRPMRRAEHGVLGETGDR
eukprot:682214-Pyramimonas_sp.AAC.1